MRRLECVAMSDRGRTWEFENGDVMVQLVADNGTERVECYARPVGETGSYAHRGTRHLNGESSQRVAARWATDIARDVTGEVYV